jgi:hypothetical protein
VALGLKSDLTRKSVVVCCLLVQTTPWSRSELASID